MLRSTRIHLRNYWMLYAMAVPGVVWLVLFRYIPMMGSIIAFQDYQIFRGIWKSPWVGFLHFERLFASPDFYRVFRNTLILGFYNVFLTFPIPIALAVFINEVQLVRVKRTIQTILYLPHFFSWVIIAGLTFSLLSYNGPINTLLSSFGYRPILFMQRESLFRFIVTTAAVYKEAGWGTIVFLAAITGIDTQLYEASMIDGANRFQRIFHITIPCILPTAVILLLLRIGNFMTLGFDSVYNFLTPLTYSVGDIFDTYVFRVGITSGRYSFTTAVGLFQSAIGVLFIWGFNRLSKKISGGLW
jgi:putative aldouronate transport system permease protein